MWFCFNWKRNRKLHEMEKNASILGTSVNALFSLLLNVPFGHTIVHFNLISIRFKNKKKVSVKRIGNDFPPFQWARAIDVFFLVSISSDTFIRICLILMNLSYWSTCKIVTNLAYLTRFSISIVECALLCTIATPVEHFRYDFKSIQEYQKV